MKSILFDEIDFACGSPALMAEIQSSSRGNIRIAFAAYDIARSKDALRQFNETTFQYFPEEALTAIAEAPLMSHCHDVARDDSRSTAGDYHATQVVTNWLIATLHRSIQDSLLVISKDNVVFDLEIQLDRPPAQDVDFVVEVPDSCTLIPARHVFLTPNPVRIQRGQSSAKLRATFISDNIRKGTDQLFVARLVNDKILFRANNELAVRIRKVETSR